MDKKVKFSDRPLSVKIVYVATIAILVICAVVLTVVSVASRKDDTPAPDVTENGNKTEDENASAGTGTPEDEEKPKEEPSPTFISPVVGTVSKEHSLDAPVFSETLDAWRTHKGIDITTAENCAVFAAADGVVTAIYDDAFHGRTVEVTHAMNIKTVYSNLAKEDAAFVSVGDKVLSGDRIGTVGYTAIFEIAEEPHLHFEMTSDDESVDPLDYISEESKNSSLGMKN